MESENDRLLTSVLTHEYIHIRRFDTAAKILLAAVLCVYWFHPMVWVMVMLANRDMELACDEGVLRTLGEKQRAGYALSLLDMEERKSRGFTLCSHFSRYAIEERTLSIMRYQKCSIPASIAAVMLVSGFALILAAFPVVPGSQTDSLRTDSPSGYLLDEMDDWLAELQTTADRLVAGNQLTQQQEDRLLTYYQAQIAHLQSSAANGGEITVDLPAQNTGPVHCPLDQLTYLLPDTDDVLECCRDGTELPAVTAILPQDMSALPFTQQVNRDGYLIEGRWLNADDNAASNPVCVILQDFAEKRGLHVGDTLTITLSDEQMSYSYYPEGTAPEEMETSTVTTTFTIVGIFNRTIFSEGYTSASCRSLTVYIPDSCMPSGYNAAVTSFQDGEIYENGYSFVLTGPDAEEEFLRQYRSQLESMGYTVTMIENGWTEFSASARPICQSAAYSAGIFAIVQVMALLLVAFLYRRQHRQEFAIARALSTGAGLLLADEPTGNLDEANSIQVMELLLALAHTSDRCVIVVTHDLELAPRADQLLYMKGGALVSG